MNLKRIKKILIINLCGILFCNSSISLSAQEIDTDNKLKTHNIMDINIHNSFQYLTDPICDETNEYWDGSTILMGNYKYENNSIDNLSFQVLDAHTFINNEPTILLNTEEVLNYNTLSYTDSLGMTEDKWNHSQLKEYLNNDFTKIFTPTELSSIVNVPSSDLLNDQFFILSSSDMHNAEYGFNKNNLIKMRYVGNEQWDNQAYWLRDTTNNQLNYVSVDGSLQTNTYEALQTEQIGFSPACYINISDIRFLKSSTMDKDMEFQMISDQFTNQNSWTMVLQDGDHFEASFSKNIDKQNKMHVKVTHPAVGFQNYTQTSAALIDYEGNLLAYGKIGDAEEGIKSFKLPILDDNRYTIYVFQEKINSFGRTDYISNIVSQQYKNGTAVSDQYNIIIQYDETLQKDICYLDSYTNKHTPFQAVTLGFGTYTKRILGQNNDLNIKIPNILSSGENSSVQVLNSGNYDVLYMTLVDIQSNTIVAFGSIGDAAVGIKSFTIPDTLVNGEQYKICIFAENSQTHMTSNVISHTFVLGQEILIPETIKNSSKDITEQIKKELLPETFYDCSNDCNHSIDWSYKQTINGIEDVEVAGYCSNCGHSENILLTGSAFYYWNHKTANDILQAPANGVIKLRTENQISFKDIVYAALDQRPDVTLELIYRYQSNWYHLTIKGGNLSSHVIDGHIGFLYLNTICPVTQITDWSLYQDFS